MSFPLGPLPAGYPSAPALLTLRPDFSEVSEELQVTVDRAAIGFTREVSATFYPHEVSRAQSARYTLQDDEIALLLSWFVKSAGRGASFWAAGCFNGAIVAADTVANAVTIPLQDAPAFVPGDYVCVFTDRIHTAKVQAVTADSLSLYLPFGTALIKGDAILPLCLARLEKPLVSISWRRPGAAIAKLDWTELRPELVPASDENLGTTLGGLPSRVILFEFSRNPDNPEYFRYTNYETDLVWSSNTFSSRSVSHGDIKQSLNLEADGVSLESFNFPASPIATEVALKSETPLSLVIRHADYDGSALSNIKIVFTGELSSFSRRGSRFSVKFQTGPRSLDDMLPRIIRGPFCNNLNGANPDGSFLISYGCALLKADWEFTATVAAPVSSAYPYVLNLSNLVRVTGSTPTYFQDWFAYGWIESPSGNRMILKSTVPVGGALSLTLHRWFDVSPVIGQSVSLFPGCDGTRASCKAYHAANNPLGKFNNYPNFLGYFAIPAGNPSLQKAVKNPARGSKKS